MDNEKMWKDYTVAIIEDSQSLSHALADKLHRAGFQVLLASDGESGLEAVIKQQPHLTILDILMPKMDGFEFLERLRKDERGKNTPVIIASNSERADHQEKARKFKCTKYFVKANTTIQGLVLEVEKTLTSEKNN